MTTAEPIVEARPVAQGKPAEPSTRPPAGWGALAVVLVGTFVTFLDFFIVNVALPSLRTGLHAGPSAVSLVVAGYGITFAVGMITGGRLGDRYGRQRLFRLGLGLFTVTSLACGVAPNIEVLIVSRALQGAAGALLTPQVLAILATTYAGARRERAFAAYGLAMGVAGVLGQLLGGALIQADVAGLGWRAIFLINVPIGLLTLPLIPRYVPQSFGSPAKLDLFGVALATTALTTLVLPLAEGREQGWPEWTWLLFGISLVTATGFLYQQHRAAMNGRAPLVDLQLFRSRRFTAGTAAGLVFSLVPSSFFFVLALYLQSGRGYSALFSGLIFVAVGVGYFEAMLLATKLAQRLGHYVLGLGALIAAAGCVALVPAAGGSSSWELLPGLALVGFGIGTFLVPLSALVLAGVDPLHAGAAAGVLATGQQVGGALGVAAIGIAFFGRSGVTPSFELCLWLVAGLAVLAAVASRFLKEKAAAES